MKHCPKCNTDKEVEEFCINRERADGRQGYCRRCMSEATKKCYRNNYKKHYNKQKERNQGLYRFLREYKESKPCVDCGKFYPFYVYDFHHREKDEKDFTISEMRKRRMGIDRIKAEIEKCDLLCSNCHRIRHKGSF